MAFLVATKKKDESGKTKVLGKKIVYNDAKALMGMYHEIIHDENYKFISKHEAPVIVDVGANIGISILYFYSLYPNSTLIAVEADPKIAEILSNNLKINNCPAEVIQKALWSEPGLSLSFAQKGADAGTLYGDENTVDVKTISIPELLAPYEYIDLLKIDIEGAEIEVLKNIGTSFNKVDHVFIEFHSFLGQPQNLEFILQTMAEQGFRYKILPGRKVKTPFLPEKTKHDMDLQLNIFFSRDFNHTEFG
ncbi:MAG: FkbM family methyltransferase [Fluviicola sp.]